MYCHQVVHIAHRDIKPENILVDNNDDIKLTDFGVSDFYKTSGKKDEEYMMTGNAGSDCYFSPEACSGQKYSGNKADIWACAVTLYQMTFLKLPFESNNRLELYKKIKLLEPLYPENDLTLDSCPGFKNLKDLLTQMFYKDP